jgi:hypothetical protein
MEEKTRTFRQAAFRLLFIVVGIVALVTAFQEFSSISHLKTTGVSAVVDPVMVAPQHRSARRSATFTAEISFRTAQGQPVTRTRSFSRDVMDEFDNGRPVNILYDPKNPSEFMFEKESWPWSWLLAGLVALVAGIFWK